MSKFSFEFLILNLHPAEQNCDQKWSFEYFEPNYGKTTEDDETTQDEEMTRVKFTKFLSSEFNNNNTKISWEILQITFLQNVR